MVNVPDTQLIQNFTLEERARSSTWCKLKTVLLFLKTHAHKLCNQQVLLYTDNTGVTAILRKGSVVTDLQSLVLEVYSLCIKNSISLCSAWVPRDMNQAADALSKTIDPDDWGISQHIFLYFQKIIGVFTLDVFANNQNKKCNNFF